jgi:methionine biosynthesis protein MetW
MSPPRVSGLDPTAQHRPMRREEARNDLQLVADMVDHGARVLDLGCGDGALLSLLADTRGVDARGLELSQGGVNLCVARGLSVIQGDADTDLATYPDDAFDYVILSQTLQAVRRPKTVLENMLRIGRRAIVSFPNFGHWRVRLELGLRGRMPVTETLPVSWHETPNIHFCTIRDFLDLAREIGATIERGIVLDRRGRVIRDGAEARWNLFGEQAVFLLKR